MDNLIRSLLLFYLLFFIRIHSTSSQPTTLTCTELNFTSISLTTGQLIQSYAFESPHFITSLLKCSGNDYYVLASGPDSYQPGYFNISILNGETGTFTTKATFYIPENPMFIYQSNSIDLPSGLAFTTFCNSGSSYIYIFDMNTETVETIATNNHCVLYTFGAYDPTNQLYYLYGYETGTRSSLSFGVYSMITKNITYYDIPFEMQFWSSVETIHVYESIVYVGLLQDKYYQVITIDFNTKTTRSIFKADFQQLETTAEFVLDPNGYMVVVSLNPPNYNIFTIDLQTEQYTNQIKLYE
ncbi:hypothetical protein PPL_04945 [Heterostelium album PN500]|uniref:Uncharacterized protein n=1 Tax=Heterostelium pallidum (strain ATCC 26659 / Pp 5 / PN500) TaxID=670386 RepID=D3B901_HETP5|nr:hypothetical protein PPL_04945 [Heterostelium album PN500]EFA82040.1 hypothetical protein PPL_04945 [Heterostelium album PN500]|eukprot:XP_020434157.1 hypothetical protein PPL_04945 [Heterostelium album PN500]